jgi:tRNA-2-methylthio-N6-dimethylallyladenosine synthase
MELVREVQFASAFSFKYSPRPGTPAATMHGQIAPDVADARLQRLQALLAEQQRAFNAAQVGRRLPILVTGKGRKPGQAHGRSPFLQAVHFEAEAPVGAIVEVEIKAASQNSLTGALACAPPQAMATS